MNIKVVLCLCLVITMFSSVVHADYSTIVSYDYEATVGNTLSNTNNMANTAFIYLYTDLVENLDNVVYQELIEAGTNQFAGTAVTSSTFQGKISSTVVCTGLAIFSGSSDDKHDRLSLYFDYWNVGSLTGNKIITLTYFDGVPASVVSQASHSGYPPAGMVYGGPNGGLAAPVIHQTTLSTPYKTYFSVNNTDFSNIVKFNYNRVVEGVTYASLIDVRETDDSQSIFIENNYAVGGSGYAFIDKYPALVTVQFGYPTAIDTTYYTIPGEDTDLIYEGSPLITPTPTPTPTSGCGVNIGLSLSKTSSIAPLTEYINASISLSGDYELITGSTIGYYIGAGSGGTINPVAVATFTNTTGGWYYNRNDLGSTSNGYTTYDDIFSELIRFPDSGNYIVRAAVMPYGSCSKYDEKYVYVNPSSQVNLDIYFKDGITYNMIPSVTSAISIVNVTGNTTYSGNPIGIATQIGQTVSIYATAEGYTPKHIYYTIPSSVYGNTLDIPFFMFPTDYGEYYPDNTTWTITVKSLTSGENLYGASVRASDYSGTIDEGYTNSDGYVTLFVPFRDSPVRLDVAKVPYISSSQWVNLGNATEYSTTVYLNYGGTPTPTPSYNYTYTVTPTQTDTPIPTVTQITNPMLTVWVRDAITNLPIGDAYVYIYDGDEIDQTYKGSLIYSSTTDSVQGATPKLQMIANNAYWVVVSKSGYYTLEKRFRMSSQDASIFAPLQPSHGVTIATTQPTLVLPTPGGTGIQGGFIGWILDYFSEWFGVDVGTARILLALFIIMCSSVFVGGSLAGFGSGAGAGMGALIGGMFAFIAMCYVQFLPFWLLPIGIAFVGMAFFVWNRQEK